MMKQYDFNSAKRFKYAENCENENPNETISSIGDPESPCSSEPILPSSTPQTGPLGPITNKFPNSYPYPQYNYNYYPTQENYNFNYYQNQQYNQNIFNPRLQVNRNSIGSSGSDTSNSSLNLNSPQPAAEFAYPGQTGEKVTNGKKRRAVPVENKDETYWEKRRKNNESAKRSRDMRRSKEEHISIRVIYLEQENLQLKTELALMRNETEKLRAMLYAASNSAAAAAVAVAATANSVNH